MTDNPLSLRAKHGVALLSVSVIERTIPYNKLDTSLNRERTEATITFDYLDHNDGALIQIFHTGSGSDDIQLEGTIKGARSIQRRSLVTPPSLKQLSRWSVLPVVCLTWILLALAGYMMINPPHFQPKAGGITLFDTIQIGLLILLGFLIGVGAAYGLYITSVPKRLSKIHWRKPLGEPNPSIEPRANGKQLALGSCRTLDDLRTHHREAICPRRTLSRNRCWTLQTPTLMQPREDLRGRTP